MPLEVVIVKADALSSEGLRRAVQPAVPTLRITSVSNGATALSLLQRRPVDLAIIGLDLPGIDGIELMARVVADRLAGRVLAIAERRDQCSEYFCSHAGLDGMIDARVDGEKTVTTAVRRVLSGEKHFPPEFPLIPHGELDIFEHLTSRELEVLGVIGSGGDDTEWSARLKVCASTVHGYRDRIMWKLGIRNRSDIIIMALHYGVVRFTPAGKQLPGLVCARLKRRLKNDENRFATWRREEQVS